MGVVVDLLDSAMEINHKLVHDVSVEACNAFISRIPKSRKTKFSVSSTMRENRGNPYPRSIGTRQSY